MNSGNQIKSSPGVSFSGKVWSYFRAFVVARRARNERCKISKRRISSSGQKLPKDWENKVKSIIVHLQKYRHHNEGVTVAGVAGCRMRIWAIQTRFPSIWRTIATVLGVGGRIMNVERLVLPVRKKIG
jgi:hypothetical protein